MQESRANFTTLGIAAAIAILFGGWLWISTARLQAQIEQQTAAQAAQYRYEASLRASSRCALVPRAEIPACVYNEYAAARQSEHDAYDLQAQLVTSLWTQAMGMAAIVGMAVGMFGLGLIYKTFEETRLSAAEAREANQISRADQRAWLSVDCRTSNFRAGRTQAGVDGYYITVEAVVANHGGSPATNVRLNAELRVPPDDLDVPALMRFCEEWRARDSARGPAVFPTREAQLSHELFLAQSDIAPATIGEWIHPVVFGCVSYHTAHAEGVRQTSFLLHLCAVAGRDQPVSINVTVENWWHQRIAIMGHPDIIAE